MYDERVRGCDGDDNVGVVTVSAGFEYMGGTRVSGFVSTADDVLEMSVVRGVRGVCGVCGMGMCLGRGGVGGMLDERIGFVLYQSCRNRSGGVCLRFRIYS